MSDAREDPAAAPAARSSGDGPDAVHDDDELAAVLQEQIERFSQSGVIPIVPADLIEQDRLRRLGNAAAPSAPAAAAVPAPDAAEDEAPVRPSWPSFARADGVAAAHPAPHPAPAAAHAAPPAVGDARPGATEDGTEQRRPGGHRAERTPRIPTRLPTAPIPTVGRAQTAPAVPDLRFSSPVPHFEPPAAIAPPGTAPGAEAVDPARPALGTEDTTDGTTSGEPAEVADAVDAVEAPSAASEPSEVRVDPTPTAALRLLEQLQPALEQVHLDPEAYREWEESLRAVAESAPPPPVTSSLPVVPAPVPPPAAPPLLPPEPGMPSTDPAALTASALGLAPAPARSATSEPIAVGPLRGVRIEEPHEDDEVISAELVDDEDGHADEEPPTPAEAPPTGVVPVQASPMPASGSAALAFRSRPAAPEPAEPGEVAALDLDGITAHTGPVPTSIVPIVTALDRDLDDDVDDVEEPGELLPVTGSVPISDLAETGSVAPVPSASVRPGVISTPTTGHTLPSPFAVEAADLQPTEEDQRLRRPVAQFWLWLAPNASALTLALGGALLALGLSFRQAVVAAILGVAVACATIVVDVLAVARTAQPVAVVSRATFGLRGNVLPTIVLLLVRLFWAVTLAWLAAGAVAAVVDGAGWTAVAPATAGVVAAVVLPVVAGLVAVFGHGLLARVHLVLGILSAALVVLLLVLTSPMLDLGAVLATPDGAPLRVVGGGVAVFSLLAIAWASAGGELARYQRPGASDAATSAWAALGAAAPALLLTVWGALLTGSSPADLGRLDAAPVAALLQRLPTWAPVPLLIAVLLGLVAALATVLYSTGLTLGAAGVRGTRAVRTVPAAVVALAGGIALLLAAPRPVSVLADLVPVIAAPVAAWTGLVAAELVLRRPCFDTQALLRPGGRYPGVRWPMVAALAGLAVLGIGLVGRGGYAPFAGYLWTLFGVPGNADLAQSDLGVPLALVLGFALPFLGSRDEVRRQERWTSSQASPEREAAAAVVPAGDEVPSS